MHLELAEAALDRNNGRQALQHLAASGDVESSRSWTIRAKAWVLEDETERALDGAKRGLLVAPEDLDLLLTYAVAQYNLSNPVEAERALLVALNKHPTYGKALYIYSLVLLDGGDTDGAHLMLNRLEEVAGPFAESLSLRARVCAAEGKERDADRFAELALEADPESGDAAETRYLLSVLKADAPSAANAGLHAAQLDPQLYAIQGRQARFIKHPAMLPHRLVDRVGMVPISITTSAFFALAARYLDGTIMLIAAVTYLVLAGYTWVAPPILRWWLRRKGQL